MQPRIGIMIVVVLSFLAAVPAGSTPSRARAADGFLADLADLAHRAADFTPAEWHVIVGTAAFRRGEWKTAARHFQAVNDALALIADHLLFSRAVCALQLSDFAAAESLIDELRNHYPDSVWQHEAARVAAEAAIGLKQYDVATRALKDYRAASDNARDDRDADLLLLRVHIGRGDHAAASELVRRLFLSASGEEEYRELVSLAHEADDHLGLSITAWLDESLPRFLIARSFADHAHWDEAIPRLQELLTRGDVTPTLRAEAAWILGVCLVRVDRYQEAVVLFEEIRETAGSGPFRRELLSRLATTYAKLGRIDDAIMLRMSLMHGKGLGIAREMTAKIANLYVDQGRYQEALIAWEHVLALRPPPKLSVEARWNRAWCFYKLGEYERTLESFAQLLKTGAAHYHLDHRVRYWQGRVLVRLGREAEAQQVFGALASEHAAGYYAELARRRLTDDVRDVKHFATADWDGVAPSAWTPVIPSLSEAAELSPHLARALFFHRLGLAEEVRRELAAIESPRRIPAELLLWLAMANHVHDRAQTIARSTYAPLLLVPPHDDFSRFVWEAAFPRAYDRFVNAAIAGDAFDPRLVVGFMWAESTYRPDVVSPAGAIGLMQLMPTTAADLARATGKEYFSSRDLFRPAINIEYGVRYLKKLQQLFPDNPIAWIAAYNAGEAAVARWLSYRPLLDVEEFIEEIPYQETNLYVKKVLTAYWAMQRLYDTH